MRRFGFIAAVSAIVVAASVSAGMAGGRPLDATLTAVPSSSSATGTAEITLNQGQEEVCFDLTWANTSGSVTAAHIHRVADNSLAVGFFNPPSGPVVNSGCVTASAEIIKAIRQDPGAFYVNIHTSAFPGGELAGTLG